jgi:hypothetical protein
MRWLHRGSTVLTKPVPLTDCAIKITVFFFQQTKRTVVRAPDTVQHNLTCIKQLTRIPLS